MGAPPSWWMNKTIRKPESKRRRRLPRSFKDLTPSQHFKPSKFFYEMIWKVIFTKRTGQQRIPRFPTLSQGQMALTWIGHSSFLAQFNDLNVLIDPVFANWIFLVKRLKRPGLRLDDLPPVDLVLLSHAHFDHFHKPTLRKLPRGKLGIMPWGMGVLARGLGFDRVIELQWWESFTHGDWKVTLTPCNHWGARVLHDAHRGYGGFVLEHQGRRLYHAGDTAYFDGFGEIGRRCAPDVALLPIGAYYPDSFRKVHMGPDDAVQAFKELKARQMVPMHYGTFKLSFEDLQDPPHRLDEIARALGCREKIRILEEGSPEVF